MKVLIADDDRAVLDIVREGLEAHGYSVITAVDGVEAFRKVKMQMPDAAILDILMPGMDGVTMAASMKLDVETREIPIIFLTGFISKEKEKEFQKEIKNALFLSKPFTLDELLSTVCEALKKNRR